MGMNYHSRKEWNKVTITLLIILTVTGVAAYMLAGYWINKNKKQPQKKSKTEKLAEELGPEYFKSLLKNPPNLTGKNLFKIDGRFFKDSELENPLSDEEAEKMNQFAIGLKKQFETKDISAEEKLKEILLGGE